MPTSLLSNDTRTNILYDVLKSDVSDGIAIAPFDGGWYLTKRGFLYRIRKL